MKFLKRTWLLLASVLLCLSLNAQIKTILPSVGKIIETNKPIEGQVYEFNNWIYKHNLDTNRNGFHLVLRKTGKKNFKKTGSIVFFDLSTDKIKWTKETQTFNQTFHKNQIFYLSRYNEFLAVSAENGRLLWNHDMIKPMMTFEDIGLAFTDKMSAIELESGHIIWKRPVSNLYGWNDYTLLNDSTFILAASGLHTFDLKTGQGWDIKAVTGKKDYSSTAAANAAGIGLGLLTGTFMVSGGYDVVHQLASNIYIDSANIYFASKDNLLCANHKGEINWTVSLPENKASSSTIFIHNGNLIMINSGKAKKGYRSISYGRSFVASYNLSNGTPNYIAENIPSQKIEDFILNNDTVTLLFGSEIAELNLSTGEIIQHRSYDLQPTEYFDRFTFSRKFHSIKEDSLTFEQIVDTASSNYYPVSKDDNIYTLSKDLEIQNKTNIKHIYFMKSITNNHKIITKKDKTWVVDQVTNKTKAQINVEGKIAIYNDNLFYFFKKKMTRVDLKSVW